MYQLLLKQRDTLLTPDKPLYAFKQQPVRIAYRPDRAYKTILPKLLTPEYLRDGVERSILLEQSGQDLIPVEYLRWRRGNDARWWPVFVAEQQAMARGDLPYFTACTDSDTLTVSAEQDIASCLHQPGFDLVLARFTSLGQKDMNRQIGCIERVLDACGTARTVQCSVNDRVEMYEYQDTVPAPMMEALMEQALHIAEDLSRQAVDAGDGSALWLMPTFLQRSQCYQLLPMRYSLFDGSCGVALFLAAATKISGEASFRKLALAALQPLRQVLRSNSEQVVREMGIGGAAGLGSVVYAFTRISQFLDEPSLLVDAREAATSITADRIANEQSLDVIAGAAGAILGLLALYDVSHDQAILERAVICGQHLLQMRTVSKAGYLAWPTPGGRHSTGFSHGAAGIAYALVRLYTATKDACLLAAAREGLAYEDCAFLPEAGNWADELVDGEPTSLTTWCHGAPGIGLARLGGLLGLDTAHIREEIEIALRTTRRVGTQGPDHLCCGNLGRAELLLVASQRLARPELAVTARYDSWSVVTRAQRKGMFCLQSNLPAWVPLPKFFHGTSGIGYALLRMARPLELPSVLLWE
jgi:type 2 lantibiotic biosynthesis protein LanM